MSETTPSKRPVPTAHQKVPQPSASPSVKKRPGKKTAQPEEPRELILSQAEADLFLERNGQEAYDKANIKIVEGLPPINLESPDGERVIQVRDPKKAQSMTERGWKITDRAKTPYKAPEHLSDKPLSGHEGLQALRRSLQPKRPTTPRQKSAKRTASKEKKS